MLIVGAIGSGKTSACMYPFVQQLLSWQADRPERRASALILEVIYRKTVYVPWFFRR